MVDGRKKGNAFENDVCRLLTRWTGYGDPVGSIDALPFRRLSTSIMPVTGHWNGGGDICCRDGLYWPFAVECKCVDSKRRRNSGKVCGWELDGALYLPEWCVWKWWEQAKSQAKTPLHPLLVFTRSNRPVYVMWSQQTEEKLCLRQPTLPSALVCRASGNMRIMTAESLLSIPFPKKRPT